MSNHHDAVGPRAPKKALVLHLVELTTPAREVPVIVRVPVSPYAMDPKSMGSRGMLHFQLLTIAPGDPSALSVAIRCDVILLRLYL